ncbi:hypothetical protein ACTXT7_016237, partial [Hymenolepis weldensis]
MITLRVFSILIVTPKKIEFQRRLTLGTVSEKLFPKATINFEKETKVVHGVIQYLYADRERMII